VKSGKITKRTSDVYRRWKTDFSIFCRDVHTEPPTMTTICDYLRYINEIHGPSCVAVAASAIAYDYRSQGKPFDTKNPQLQDVLSRAREQIWQEKNPE
jgi:hypothetical protein